MLSRIVLLPLLLISCTSFEADAPSNETQPDRFVVILGVAQDAGYPQAGCKAPHCQKILERRRTCSLCY